MLINLLAIIITLAVVEATESPPCAYMTSLVTSQFDPHGVLLHSPNYPKEYPSDADVCWRVTTDDSRLTVKTFPYIIEDPHDHLTIYDGPDRTGTQLARLTGEGRDTATYQSTGSAVFLTFTTDESVRFPGFLVCVCAAALDPCECEVSEDLLSPWDDQHDDEPAINFSVTQILPAFGALVVIASLGWKFRHGLSSLRGGQARGGHRAGIMAATMANTHQETNATGQPHQVQNVPQGIGPSSYGPSVPQASGQLPTNIATGSDGLAHTGNPSYQPAQEGYPPYQPAQDENPTFPPAQEGNPSHQPETESLPAVAPPAYDQVFNQ